MIGVKFSDPQKSPEFNEAVGEFVSNVIYGEGGHFSSFCSLAVLDGGDLIAGVLYHHFSRRDGVMEMSAASIDKRWLTRPVLKAMFTVPFELFGCQLAVLRVSEHNAPMLRIAKAYGFKEYVIPRLRGRSEAEHILTLADDDWRANRFDRGRS
ncbi:RimJ/RimL family protein N-acetyltransferase [Afipia massiliensis]|uniref:RimJ/RimL family protein N-acetyltransferase n=1 Tax=Afipia massiliensis TaxID=211460 RepID=A0A840MWJ0_9BRAD|nr:GNAT family protein [Afipia massiliensis]MBB5051120.1 RimJ/RimL family protein N-acetyltransferase [Afipia massiliensis]